MNTIICNIMCEGVVKCTVYIFQHKSCKQSRESVSAEKDSKNIKRLSVTGTIITFWASVESLGQGIETEKAVTSCFVLIQTVL